MATLTEPEGMRDAIRHCLEAKSQSGLDVVAAMAAVHDQAEIFEKVAREELARLPRDLHEWWDGPCNCDGHLN